MSSVPAGDPNDPVRRAYDTMAADYAAALPDTRAESPLELALLDALVEAVRSTPSTSRPRVLDAGCGTGRVARHLAAAGLEVTGADLSPGMVAMARNAQPDLDLVVASLLDLPFADGHFDGVLLWYSTIHLPPERHGEVFAEVARVLGPGGHVLVGFQAGTGTRDVRGSSYGSAGAGVELQRHLVTADATAERMAEAGLREQCRVVRRAQGHERDDQAFLLASR